MNRAMGDRLALARTLCGGLLAVALLALCSATSAASYRIAFASNLQAASGGCYRDDMSGCDLYTALYDAASGEVSALTRITAYSDASENFPALSPDGNWLAYDHGTNTSTSRHEVRLVNLQSLTETTLLADARFPEWIDATHLLLSTVAPGNKDVALIELDLATGTPSIKSQQTICNRTRCPDTSATEDPYPFPGGTRIAFQSTKSDRYVAGLSLINVDGTGFQMPNGWDTSGHVIVSTSGNEIVYALATTGALQVLNLSTSGKTALPLPTSGASLIAYDTRYASAASLSWAYAAWLDGSRSLLLSGAGADAHGAQYMSRLLVGSFAASWGTVSLYDLSSAIERLAGKSGKDFVTASARAVSSSTTTSAASPILGIQGADASDLTTIRSLGANTAEIALPESDSDFTSALAEASSAGLKLMLRLDRTEVQTAALKFDLGKLSSRIASVKTGLLNAGVAGLLIAEDLCQVNPNTHARKWDINAAELAAAITTIKSIAPGLAVAVAFNKSSCLDTYVAGASAGANIADLALLNCFYYKWTTAPDLIGSYQASAVNFKRFSPSSRVLPRIGVVELVGDEASAFPSTDWLTARSQEFFAYGGAFDGVLYYDYRQQEARQTRNIINVIGDASYLPAFQSLFAAAQSIYGVTPAVQSFVEYYEPELDHYFITASSDEQAYVYSGAAGNWQRTGYFFKEGGSSPVCRFYGNTAINPATGAIYGPNSHFYTVSAAECASLKSAFNPNAASWKFESDNDLSTPASSSGCASGYLPVYRAYNNGAARGVDSNHRLTSSSAAYQASLAADWLGEGVVMCAPQ